MTLKQRIINILVTLDQSAWTLASLGAGYPDETISAGLYRLSIKGSKFGTYGAALVDWLFFWQDQHCKQAYLDEFRRRQLHPHYSKDKP